MSTASIWITIRAYLQVNLLSSIPEPATSSSSKVHSAEKKPLSRMDWPIFKLDHDLLWNIFLINADMEHEIEHNSPAIQTLRHTSQVCSDWRDLIIASSSLWARVIDFDWLRNEDWRKEVMRRTGTSLLSVRWHTNADVDISKLADNWSRLRSLDIAFSKSVPEDFKQDADLWHLLERPARLLESFQLMLHVGSLGHGESHPNLSPPEFKIFDDHAPSLAVFFAPGIKFSIRAPWTSHIRRLALNAPVSVDELLKALAHMPLLETLEDHYSSAIIIGNVNPPRSIPKVLLPRLQDIKIFTSLDITSYMIFLAHLQPVVGRLLTFRSHPCDDEYDPNAQAIAASSEVLSMYSQHAGLAASTEVVLQLLEYRFYFDALLPTGRSFWFIQNCNSHLPQHAVVHLLNALKFPDFHVVRHLRLTVQERCGILPSDSKFAKFITSFSSLEILAIGSETMKFVLRLPNEVLKVAFPVVRKIEVSSPSTSDVPSIHAFFRSRTALGRPIPTLEVKTPRVWKLDLTSLEEFTGLKVTIMSAGRCPKVYACGSGNPAKLLFDFGMTLSPTTSEYNLDLLF